MAVEPSGRRGAGADTPLPWTGLSRWTPEVAPDAPREHVGQVARCSRSWVASGSGIFPTFSRNRVAASGHGVLSIIGVPGKTKIPAWEF
jgi:hypothetical protein